MNINSIVLSLMWILVYLNNFSPLGVRGKNGPMKLWGNAILLWVLFWNNKNYDNIGRKCLKQISFFFWTFSQLCVSINYGKLMTYSTGFPFFFRHWKSISLPSDIYNRMSLLAFTYHPSKSPIHLYMQSFSWDFYSCKKIFQIMVTKTR
jgi:hypothetical protein